MRGFDNEGTGTFYICTEHSERNYVIKKVSNSNLDRVLNEVPPSRNPADLESISSLMLPWWFTKECEQQLLSVPAEAKYVQQFEQPAQEANQMTPDQLKARLKSQLEYYFSRENIATDRYLRIQMDADQYVPIKIVANFPKVSQLTTDYDLIVQVLRESSHVQVDEIGEKVRAASKRCTIILREIPENTDEREVKAMFDGSPPYQSLVYGLNNSWYVTFETEEQTQKAYQILMGKSFNGKPIYARIKTGGAPAMVADPNMNFANNMLTSTKSLDANGIVTTSTSMGMHYGQPVNQASHHGFNHSNPPSNFNLGEILAGYGYVPRATYRPANVIASFVPVSSAGHSAQQTSQPTFLSRSHLAAAHSRNSTSPTTTAATTTSSSKQSSEATDQSQVPASHSMKIYDEKPQPLLPNLGRQRITDMPRMNKGRMNNSPFVKYNGSIETTKSNTPTATASHNAYSNSSQFDGGYNNNSNATNNYTSGFNRYEHNNAGKGGFNNSSSSSNRDTQPQRNSYRGSYDAGRNDRGRGKPRSFQDNYNHSHYNTSSNSQTAVIPTSRPPPSLDYSQHNPTRPYTKERSQAPRYEATPPRDAYVSLPKSSASRESLTVTPNSPVPPPSEALSSERGSRQKQHSESSEYNFTEMEFPSLANNDHENRPQPPALPPEKPPPFSAVVAGKKNMPKVEPKKKSYAQSLKTSEDHETKLAS